MMCIAYSAGKHYTLHNPKIRRYQTLPCRSSIHYSEPQQLDPLLSDCGQDSRRMKNFLSEVKRLESMPNYREPINIKMTLHVINKCDR